MADPTGWGINPESWKRSNPIGKHTENLIWNNADWVIYCRIKQDDHCPKHWDQASKTENGVRLIDAPCPYCWGTGRRVVPVITPIRISAGSPDGSNDLRVQPGYMEDWSYIGYVPRVLKPQMEDIIYQVEWNVPVWEVPTNPNRRPTSVHTLVTVKANLDRFEQEVAFQSIDLKTFDIESSILNRNIPFMVNLPILTRESWPRTSYW